jgi:hypothetical protein
MAYPGALMVDDAALFKAMRVAGAHGALTCVHAENGPVIAALIEEALEAALGHMLAMRVKEGAHLREDVESRLRSLDQKLAAVRELAPSVPAHQRKMMQQRLAEAGLPLPLDDERLVKEIAVFADRILPLLQEYFYGQWDKVALALGYPIKADGTPKEVRGTEHGSGTFLTTQKLDEKTVLGFDHDEYVDQVAWDVHPAFRPRGKAADAWLKQAFDELVGAKGT